MKHVVLMLMLLALPARAQEVPAPLPPPDSGVEEGVDLLQRGMRSILDGLFTEMQPVIEDMSQALTEMKPMADQLFKLIDVVRISELDPRKSVERELMVATVRATPEERGQVVELTNIFEGKILSVGPDALIVSLDGSPEKLDDFSDLLRQYGILESQRTGRVALPKLDRATKVRAVKGKAS